MQGLQRSKRIMALLPVCLLPVSSQANLLAGAIGRAFFLLFSDTLGFFVTLGV